MNQMQQGLMYPVDRMIYAPLPLTLNNPPYVPQYSGANFIQGMVPIIAAATAIEVQNKASTTHLRMFMYNQMSSSNYQNAFFDKLVKNVIDYIVAGVMNGRAPNVEGALNYSVEKICTLFAANNVRNNPALSQFLDQASMAAVQSAINEIQLVDNEINNMYMQLQNQMQQNYQQPMQQNYQQPMQNNQSYRNNLDTSTSTVFNNTGFNNTGNVNRPNAGGGKYAADVIQQKAVNTMMNADSVIVNLFDVTPEASSNPESKVNKVLAKDSTAVWRFINSDKLYFPAYDILNTELYYVLDNNGKVIDVLREDRSTKLMDEERHKLNTVFGPIPEKYKFKDPELIESNLLVAVNGVNNETLNKDKIDDVNIFVDKSVSLESSLTCAWNSINLQRATTAKDRLPDVYRAYFIISNSVISDSDDTYVIAEYSAAESFIELAEKFNKYINKVGIEFWTLCNSKMTIMINRILKEELSLPNLSIDDFVLDIDELITHIENKYGRFIKNMFLKYQSNFIKSIFYIMDSEYEIDDIKYKMLEHVEKFVDTGTIVTNLYSEYSLTYINVTSFDLSIDLSNSVAAKVDERASPIIFKLLEGMFKDADARGTPFIRCLLKTNDGRIISCVRGLLNESCYLMTLYPRPLL